MHIHYNNIYALLFVVMAIFTTGCVEQKTYRLSDLFNLTETKATTDVYIATFQAASWDKYDTLRRDPAANVCLGKGIQIKFLAEALIIAATVPGAVNDADALSLPPSLVYEGLRIVRPEMALPYLDFMSQNRQRLHREHNKAKRAQKNKELHATIDTWLKANGYSSGIQGLLQNIGTRPLDNLLQYHRDFRNLPGGEKSTPWVVHRQ